MSSASAYEKVKGGKLSFKGGGDSSKKVRKKKRQKTEEEEEEGKKAMAAQGERDTGIGHAPDGKKSKEYEDLFPVETKRFGYSNGQTREDALDEREKKKADRYCK